MPLVRRALSLRAGRRLARAATQAFEFHAPSAQSFGYGIGGLHQPSHDVLLRESLGTFHVGKRAIANRLADLNPQVLVSRRETGGTLRDEVLDDHALKLLLDRPHPNFTRGQLLRLTGQWVVDVGEAYWLKVGNGFGVPTELHPVPPSMIEPVVSMGVIEGYTVRDYRGEQRMLPADVVIRFFFPDPEDPWRAEGYLGPHAITRDALKFAGEHLRYYFQHDATPKTVLEAGENVSGDFTEADKTAFRALWRQLFHNRKGTEAGMPAITPTGYKLRELAGGLKGDDVVPLLEFYRDDELLATGTPRSILGQVLSGDRSSAETNQFVFDRHTVSPIATLIADTLTLQLAPDFDASIFVRFEPFVSQDKEFELKREAQDLEHGVRTINRILEDRGDDTVEWGERPLMMNTLKPYDPSRPEMAAQPAAEGEEMDMEEGEPDEGEEAERVAHIAIRKLARQRRRARRAARA